MDRNALDWLFSTAPQAIAALVGLIAASASFILGKVDDRIEADSTLAEIGREAKEQIYSGFPRVKKETDNELIRITQKLQKVLPKES